MPEMKCKCRWNEMKGPPRSRDHPEATRFIDSPYLIREQPAAAAPALADRLSRGLACYGIRAWRRRPAYLGGPSPNPKPTIFL